MAKDEDESPSSDELKAQADEPVSSDEAAADLPDLSAFNVGNESESEDFGETPDSSEVMDEDIAASADEDTEASAEEGDEAESEAAETLEEEDAFLEREQARKARLIELLCIIGLPIIVLILAGLCAFSISTPMHAFSLAVYLIALGFIPYGVWKGRETNTLYTAILGCALAAMLTAAFILWGEMTDYGLHVKPDTGQTATARGV